MSFESTEEQNLLSPMVRGLAEAQIVPLAGQRDEEERLDRDLMFYRLYNSLLVMVP